jgi:FlaA1/EpsC-like NDP-sugar epimerase
MNDNALSELLEREPASIDLKAETYLTGKKVLVTGAGGSVGSYLCKIIAYAHPALLILVGHGEDSIHRIYGDLRAQFPTVEIEFAIASVAHEYQMMQLFERYKPDYVFHAAAHKHVPLMENNEQEAVRNNVIGTHNVAQASGYVGVRQMVLISTDKAVDPYCIMGMTKLLGEETMRIMSKYWPNTAFTAVRFGNVLGSTGSVIPIFAKQIESGGPVTVTHPDMTRYFMTPTEAVSLVLQAGGFGTSGELYLLDMGEPFRITRLAENMIKSYGLEPYTGISIVFSGVRPGEKLTETLIANNEEFKPTSDKRILLVVKPDMFDNDEFSKILHRLRYKADCTTGAETREALCEVVESITQRRIMK